MNGMERRELALGAPLHGGGALEKGLRGPPPPKYIFQEPIATSRRRMVIWRQQGTRLRRHHATLVGTHICKEHLWVPNLCIWRHTCMQTLTRRHSAELSVGYCKTAGPSESSFTELTQPLCTSSGKADMHTPHPREGTCDTLSSQRQQTAVVADLS